MPKNIKINSRQLDELSNYLSIRNKVSYLKSVKYIPTNCLTEFLFSEVITSTNLNIYGLVLNRFGINLLLMSWYKAHLTIRWNSTSNLSRKIHNPSDSGVLCGLNHLPVSNCNVHEELLDERTFHKMRCYKILEKVEMKRDQYIQ